MGRKNFSLEFKRKAIEQVKSGQHIAKVSRQCDVVIGTIKRWVKEDEEGTLDKHPSMVGGHQPSQWIVRSMRKEIDDLKRLLGSKELEISRLRERMGKK